MPFNRIPFFGLTVIAAFLIPAGAQAGFEWTPPTSKQTAPVTVPAVEAEKLDAPALPQQSLEIPAEVQPSLPVLKQIQPAEASRPPMAPPAEPALKIKNVTVTEPAISTPPADMAMPPRPAKTESGIAQPSTISVPPEEEKPIQAAAPVIETAPVVEAPKEEIKKETIKWVAEAPVAPPPAPAPEIIVPTDAPASATKKLGLTINPYPLAGKTAAPAAAAPARDMPARASVAQKQPRPGQYAEVSGFGSDVALALALRQVVPPEYSFSFAKGVNPGYRVSWNGGKAWNEVVGEMIAPLGLAYEIRGNTVVIRKADDAVMSAPAPGKSASSAVPMAPAASEDAFPAQQPRREKPQQTAALQGRPESRVETAAGDEFLATPQKPQTMQISSIDNADPDAPRIWEAKQGASLKDVLSQWSAEAGIDLVWKAQQDYKVDSGVLINGTFPNAVKVLFLHGLNPAASPRHNLSAAGDSLVIEERAS